MLIDIHTHIFKSGHFDQLQFLIGKNSLGIHPWELDDHLEFKIFERNFQELKKKFNKNILAVGECGLDRRRKGIFSIEIQIKILEWHLDWAMEVNRPIIIHCVRAYSDFLKILKSKKYKGKVLIHDYAGNIETAKMFLSYDCYFSFGARLLNLHSEVFKVFKYLPIERVFLETDDKKELTIKEIYLVASNILEIDVKEMEEIMEKNLINFFSDLNDVSSTDIINNLCHT